MERSTKLQITLTKTVMEKLVKTSKEKGVSKSGIIALALDKFFREEM